MAVFDVKLKEIQDKYATLASLAARGGFPIDPLDPLAVKCSVGDSCCAGGDKASPEDRIRTEQELNVAEAVTTLRAQYANLVSQMTSAGALSSDVMDLADSCGCGDACHTGTTDKLNSLLDEVSVQAAQLKMARRASMSAEKTLDLRTQYASLAKRIGELGEAALGSIDLVGYTCHGGEHCHGGSNRQLDRLSLVSAAAKVAK